MIGRVIAAWHSFALTASYELLARQVRGASGSYGNFEMKVDSRGSRRSRDAVSARESAPAGLTLVKPSPVPGRAAGRDLQRQAWQWELSNRTGDASLPSGKEIARRYGRHERRGRPVKRAGTAGELSDDMEFAKDQARP